MQIEHRKTPLISTYVRIFWISDGAGTYFRGPYLRGYDKAGWKIQLLYSSKFSSGI